MRASVNFHEWVLSLPWVVERPYDIGPHDVRLFAVECEPLDRRRLWLVTGLQPRLSPSPVDIAVIVPCEAAWAIEDAGWGRQVAPMPPGHTLMRASDDVTARTGTVEALALSAHSWALS